MVTRRQNNSTLAATWLSNSCCLLALYVIYVLLEYSTQFLSVLLEVSGFLSVLQRHWHSGKPDCLMSEASWATAILGAVEFCYNTLGSMVPAFSS
jgi:hypothetical protein